MKKDQIQSVGKLGQFVKTISKQKCRTTENRALRLNSSRVNKKYGTENSKFESGHPKSSCVVDSAQFLSLLSFNFLFCYLFVLIFFFIKTSVLLILYHTFLLELASYVLLAYCSQNELCQNLSWHTKVTNTRGEGKKKRHPVQPVCAI
jgi:hypothetical protein